MKKISSLVLFGALLFAGLNLPAQSGKTEKNLGPAESINHLTSSLAKGDVYQAWAYLPKAWRTDINGLAHVVGQKMPSMVWDKVFVILGRLGGVLDTKAELILGMAGGQLPPELTKEDALAAIKDLGKVLTTLGQSKISTVKSLQTIDLGDVAEGAASTIFKCISSNKLIKQLTAKGSNGVVTSFEDSLTRITAKLISQNGDKAKVIVSMPDGKTDDVDMLKVDGKWLDTDMVQGFNDNIPQLKAQLSRQLDEFAKKSMMVGGVLLMADGIVNSLENAKTTEDLKKALESIPGFNPMALLGGLGKARARAKQASSMNELKQLGVAVAMGYVDGTKSTYDGSFKQFEIPAEIDMSKYVFLRKKGDTYKGSQNIAIASEKPNPAKSSLAVVFEDGHVETIKGSFISVEQLKAALKARK